MEERTIIHGCTPGMEIPEKYLPPPAPENTENLLPPSDTYSVTICEESRRINVSDTFPGVVCEVIAYTPPILTLAVIENGERRGLWILGEPNQPVPERHMASGRFEDNAGNVYPNLQCLLSPQAENPNE